MYMHAFIMNYKMHKTYLNEENFTIRKLEVIQILAFYQIYIVQFTIEFSRRIIKKRFISTI